GRTSSRQLPPVKTCTTTVISSSTAAGDIHISSAADPRYERRRRERVDVDLPPDIDSPDADAHGQPSIQYWNSESIHVTPSDVPIEIDAG
ncbi:unnamed protein product, partial [Amoebophrya sp. A25]